jgi:ATP-binding protein involved in chromosome partitioning
MDKQNIIEILKNVQVPNIGRSLLQLGWLKDVKLEDTNVYVDLNIPIDKADLKPELNFAIIEKVKDKYPEAEIHTHFITAMGNDPGKSNVNPVGQVKNIIAVGSGKGGVGKSTIALNTALGLKALGAKVGILDADLYGPSIPTMLGIKGQKPKVEVIDGKNKIVPIVKDDLYAMSLGLVVDEEQAVVLRGPRLAGIIKQFFNECKWPELDYLIVDLPPGTGDIQLTLVQTVPVTGAVIVTTPQEVAIADAIKALNMFRLEQINVPILGVVENMSWFTPEDMPDKKYLLFGEGGGKKLAKFGKTVLLGQIPLVQGIREGSDEGNPIMLQKDHISKPYFEKVAKNLARQIAIRNETVDPTNIVNINN